MRITTTRARALVTTVACLATATIGVAAADAHADTSPASSTASAATQGPDLTSHAYFVAVLKRLRLPSTQANLDALYAVEHREGDNDRFNPLNVVQPEPGSSPYNSVGVQRYVSFQTGVAGTAHLLANGHWTGVRAALRHGDSTSAVLAAFGDAYTWSGGIKFQTERAMLDAEAVRDVGGKYADTALAAHRAEQQQSGLRATIKRHRADMSAAATTSAAAHRDWLRQWASNRDASTVVAAQGPIADTLETRAAQTRQLFVGAVTSQYMSGGDAASVGQLLDSQSATDYLSYATLQRYVTVDQRRVLKRYTIRKKQAEAVAAVVDAARATMHKTSLAMAGDKRTWSAADAHSDAVRGQLTSVLRDALANSITQPVAAAELATLRPATPLHTYPKHNGKAKHSGHAQHHG